MFFDWDARKAAANLKKHGVSFSEAIEVFGDDFSSCVADPDNSHGEARFLMFGTIHLRVQPWWCPSPKTQTSSASSPLAA